jgi:hypothetical protein
VEDPEPFELDWLLKCNLEELIASVRPMSAKNCEQIVRPILDFAGSDGGGEHWAVIASLIETCKLSGIVPHAYLTDVITEIVNGHPNSRIDELLLFP